MYACAPGALDRLCLWQKEKEEADWMDAYVGYVGLWLWGDGYIHAGAREVAPVGWAMRMFLRIKAPAYGLQAGRECCVEQEMLCAV